VLPLIPFLRGIRTFAEPCCGQGDLVRHLESFGLRCTYARDISTGQDALALDSYGACDSSADWKQTRQAAPYLPHCSDIVAIGRVKWFPGSKHTGKDNARWYRFDSRHAAGPVFHWRDQSPEIHTQRSRICEQCGKRYEQWQRSSSRFCSPAAPITGSLALGLALD
jgi:hypothetical protein